MNDKKLTTIYDIAEHVEMTPTTVSRVLNNKGYISDKTRKKVLKAAKQLNYKPNLVARSLKTGETKQIILAMPFINEMFNFDFITTIQQGVQSKGYSLLLRYTDAKSDEEIKTIESLAMNNADALILLVIDITNELLEVLSEARRPCVLVFFNSYSERDLPVDFVSIDSRKGIYMAANHLIKQGHTELGYIGPSFETSEGRERYKGFCEAMEENSLPIDQELVFNGTYTELFGYQCGVAMCESGKKATAICAASDLIALGLYRAFEQFDVRIPQDVCIVGMDNTDVCTIVKPKLSSVAMLQEELSRCSVETIFEYLDGDKDMSGHIVKHITYEPRLVIRDSSVVFNSR